MVDNYFWIFGIDAIINKSTHFMHNLFSEQSEFFEDSEKKCLHMCI